MREAIEALITELEERNKANVSHMKSNPFANVRAESFGRLSEILYVTEKLKEVLAHDQDSGKPYRSCQNDPTREMDQHNRPTIHEL